jgi:hypothetical protein
LLERKLWRHQFSAKRFVVIAFQATNDVCHEILISLTIAHDGVQVNLRFALVFEFPFRYGLLW